MPEVAGKNVVFRERFPAGDFWDLPGLIADSGENPTDYQRNIPILIKLVESWDFKGDPSDPKSYEALDILRELRVLIRAGSDYVAEMLSGEES